MTDAEKAALEWVERTATGLCGGVVDHARTLKAMLAQPRLPKEPPDFLVEVSAKTQDGGWKLDTTIAKAAVHEYHRALYAHLTKPATKTVEVWRLEWAEKTHEHGGWWPHSEAFWSQTDADRQLDKLSKNEFCACIRVTGPHKQEVPA